MSCSFGLRLLPPSESRVRRSPAAPRCGATHTAHLEKSQDGRWVKSASLTADVTQQKRVAIEMITVLAAQLLEEDPEVIRKNSVNEDGMLALGSALLARVNW